LLAAAERPALHLAIGRQRRRRVALDGDGAELIEATNHLNRATTLLAADERAELVELYARHQAQLQRLGDGEPERLARLDRAAVLCNGVVQLRPLIVQGRAGYEEARLAARNILLGASCDLTLAEQALTTMETVEANPCRGPFTNTPAEFVARDAPFVSVALRGELPRKRRECTAATAGTTGSSPPTSGPGYSIQGTWNANNGFVYEITQSGYSFTWTLANQPGLNERGQGSLTDAGQINATWTNVNGSGSAYSTVFSIDDQRRARRITWNNGILFDRPQAGTERAPERGRATAG
jgi:hypothetical protein